MLKTVDQLNQEVDATARQVLDLMCVTSFIAGLLYDAKDYPYAKDRENKLWEDYPKFSGNLKKAAEAKLKIFRKHLETARRELKDAQNRQAQNPACTPNLG